MDAEGSTAKEGANMTRTSSESSINPLRPKISRESSSFTQDPMEIQQSSDHSQIPTPTETQIRNERTPSIDPSEILAVVSTPIEVPILKAEERKEDAPRSVKKSVSIVPPSPEKHRETHQRTLASDRERFPTMDSITSERTPLLPPSSSYPTIIGIDEGSVVDFPGPSTTRSETPYFFPVPKCNKSFHIGADEFRRKRKKSRRRRNNTERSATAFNPRPFIVSPFMPIPTQVSVDPDRRSVGGYSQRDTNRNYPGYGSTTRRAEKGLLQKDSGSDEDESESDEEEEASEISKRSTLDLSSKEWITIVMLALANLCSTVAFSCIAPFYPAEAKLKGMTESQTGMVFGVFELTMFITAPLFGKYMTKFGSKRMFIVGLTITGVCAILFGFLNFLPPGASFFWFSLIIRVLEAVGDAAFVTSSFAISAKCFPGRITVVVGIMETFAGLGYTAGPLIGGFLYEFGGFQVPFLVLGAILLLATALSFWLIESQDDEEEFVEGKGMLAMLKIPIIWIMIYAIVVCAVSLSFLDPTLSAHLESFKLSPTMVGLMFLLCGGIYTLSAPVWGLLIDRFHCSITIMMFGSVTTVIAMILIGPSPLIPLEKDLVVIGISLAILGVAAGAQYIPTFQSCLDAVKLYGYDDSFHTYGCVSGLFQSAFAFGAFIGPTIGGFAVEQIGFPWTTTFIGVIHLLFILTVIIFYGSTYCSRNRNRI